LNHKQVRGLLSDEREYGHFGNDGEAVDRRGVFNDLER
jgi:hypothetical protein